MTGDESDHTLKSAAYWKERADEARTKSEGMSDGFAHNMMLEIAVMYDRLAKRAAKAEAAKRN